LDSPESVVDRLGVLLLLLWWWWWWRRRRRNGGGGGPDSDVGLQSSVVGWR